MTLSPIENNFSMEKIKFVAKIDLIAIEIIFMMGYYKNVKSDL